MDILPPAIQTQIVNFLAFLPKVFLAIFVFLVSIYLASLASKLLEKALGNRKTNTQVTKLLSQLLRYSILIFGSITALQQVNFDVAAFVTGLGVMGLALGFALQDIVANFVSGVILLIQQPFRSGDEVEIAGHMGKVLAVDLRTTQLKTLDGQDVIIPNGTVLGNAITNFTKTPSMRIHVDVGVAYDSDLDLVREVATKAVLSVPGLITNPEPPYVLFHTYGGSSIDLTVLFWIDMQSIHYRKAKDQGLVLIKKAFDENGIQIPFPIRTVYLNPEV